jgi:hypothetical protein
VIGLLLLVLMAQKQKQTGAPAKRWTKAVTPEMTAWAISIRDNPGRYPMGATETKTFAAGVALARVEQHTWTFRDGKRITGKFRGVTLYEVTG